MINVQVIATSGSRKQGVHLFVYMWGIQNNTSQMENNTVTTL